MHLRKRRKVFSLLALWSLSATEFRIIHQPSFTKAAADGGRYILVMPRKIYGRFSGWKGGHTSSSKPPVLSESIWRRIFPRIMRKPCLCLARFVAGGGEVQKSLLLK